MISPFDICQRHTASLKIHLFHPDTVQQGQGLLPGAQPVVKGGGAARGHPQLEGLAEVLRPFQPGEEARHQGIPGAHGVAHLAAAGVGQVQLAVLRQQEGPPAAHGHQHVPGALHLELVGQLHPLGVLQVIHPEQCPQLRQVGLHQEGVAGQALPQGLAAAVQHRQAPLGDHLPQDGHIEGDALGPAGDHHAVLRAEIPQARQQPVHILLAEGGAPAVHRRLRHALEFHVDPALASAAELQQLMGAAQVVQQVPDGLADAARRKPQCPGLHPQPLQENGHIDSLAAGVDDLAAGPVDLAGDQVRLHRIVQGGVGRNRIDHCIHHTQQIWYHNSMGRWAFQGGM